MIVNCVPRANVDLDELVDSGHRAMALYNKMIGRVERWLDQIDDGTVTTADIFKAYHLLAPTLDSLVTLQAKIAEQRVTGASFARLAKSGSRRVIAYGATCRGYRAGLVMPGSIARQRHNQP